MSLDLADRLYRSAARRNDPRGQASAAQRRIISLLALGDEAQATIGLQMVASLRWNVGTVHGDLPLATLRVLTALRRGEVAAALLVALEASRMLARLKPAYHGYVFDAAGVSDGLLQLLETSHETASPSTSDLMGPLAASLGALKRLARVFPIGRPWL